MGLRRLALSRSGRYVVTPHADGLTVTDALGTAPRRTVACAPDAFACVGAALWVVSRGALARYALDGCKPLPPRTARAVPPLEDDAIHLAPAAGAAATTAVLAGQRVALVDAGDAEVSVLPLAGAPGSVFPLVARRVLAARDELHVLEAGREVARLRRPAPGQVRAAASLFSGRAIAALFAEDASARRAVFAVLAVGKGVIHLVEVPPPVSVAIADERGVAVLATADRRLIAVDLRYGRISAEAPAPFAVEELALDADGQFLALAGEAGRVLHASFTELLTSPAARTPAPRSEAAGAAGTVEGGDQDDGRADGDGPDDRVGAPRAIDALAAGEDEAPRAAPAPAGPARGAEIDAEPAGAHRAGAEVTAGPALAEGSRPALRLDRAGAGAQVAGTHSQAARARSPEADGVIPRALGERLPPIAVGEAPPGAAPYAAAREHLDDLLDVVAALAARAIAVCWNTGQLSVPADDARPFQREVLAIVGAAGGYAEDLVGDAERRLAGLSPRAAARATATIARGGSLPVIELARELGLSPIATQILLVVVAPDVRGEIARLYGVLANDEHRPLVDRFLVEQVVAGGDRALRAEVARELAPTSPLVRFGAVRHAGALFGALTVDPSLVDRLCGRALTGLVGATRGFEELHLPDAVRADLVRAVERARPADAPLRLVLRGRRGAGRHTAVAALAARIGRQLAPIDVAERVHDGAALAAGLRDQLARAQLSLAVPVVSGLERLESHEPEVRAAVARALRAHPGPIVVRTTPEATLPLDPGHVSITFPALSEVERAAVWAAELARAGLRGVDADGFARQLRTGPGVIAQVIADAGGDDPDPTHAIARAARQHVARRLAHVATHVPRLARWEQVALPEDVLDSLKELISRARHRRTVFERWGYDAKLTTSRGLAALFYGPPGTGKSMVAGLVARELGLELYRVDLARVVSKWVGETEKNLAEIFDAAEDGQVVILFDEADSLFAKRTDVKTSVDRYANLEVNYLLQRLDSFEGVCILTTNLDGSIDPAFKRRMAVRLQFPHPDEETRIRLWAAHVPPEAPIAGDFDFAELARRFPLSGGYIRNSALRGAFLAAQEERPLSQAHLVRAIQLEYREIGKLSTSGRIE